MHTCMHMHVANMINMDASMSAAIYKFLYMYTGMCMHVHVCGDTHSCPQMPETPPPTCPLPRVTGAQNTKIQSLELIEIIQFCLKILYL